MNSNNNNNIIFLITMKIIIFIILIIILNMSELSSYSFKFYPSNQIYGFFNSNNIFLKNLTTTTIIIPTFLRYDFPFQT